MDFSIIIPAYEESKKIARDVQAAAEFLVHNQMTGEIIVVDDGSTDNTAHVAQAVEIPETVGRKVIRYEPHRGKGYAVRTGILASKGQYVMFADSGTCVPYVNALQGLEMLKNGECDIAHGSRRLPESNILQDQPWHRRLSSQIFKWLVRWLLHVPRHLTDTQCGFKIYKGSVARKLYAQCISEGFSFDVEIILRAYKQGYRIKEFPIKWRCDLDSRLSVARTPWPILFELRAIRKALSKDNST